MSARTLLRTPRPASRLLLLAAVACSPGPRLAAQPIITSTWTGAGGNWTNPAIWSTNPNYPNNGNPPGATYHAVVNMPGPFGMTLNAPITLSQFTFRGGIIGGTGNLTVNGPVAWSGGTMQPDATVTFLGPTTLTGGVEQRGPGTMVLDGPTTVSNHIFARTNPIGTVTVPATGTMTGSNMSFAIQSGQFIINGSYNVAGTTDTGQQGGTAGRLDFNGSTTIERLVIGGSASTFGVPVIGGTAPITVTSTLTFRSGSFDGSGAVTVAGDATFDTPPAAGLEVSVIGRSLILNGATNTVKAGVVLNDRGQINGGASGLALAGRLKGTGTVSGRVAVQSGGVIAPGASAGILHATGPVTMVAGSVLEAELNGPLPGTGYDQLDLTGGGSIALGGSSLNVLLGYAPARADAFTVLTGGPVTGTFAGLPNGAEFQIGIFSGTRYVGTITYNATSVVLSNLHPVPEPAAWLLAGGAALAWALRRRQAAKAS